MCGAAAPAPPAVCPGCDAVPLPAGTAPHVLDVQRHRLHGVLHANGFGHLARICGKEAGSSSLPGAAALSLWDRLCVALRARLVSVEDVSTKAGLPLRLLHAAAKGATWYGAAGYAFGRGAFGTGRGAHRRAVDALHRFPLAALKADFGALPRGVSDEGVLALVQRYEALSDAMAAARRAPGRKRRLHTLGELLAFLLPFCGSRGAAQMAAEEAEEAEAGEEVRKAAPKGGKAKSGVKREAEVEAAAPPAKAAKKAAGATAGGPSAAAQARGSADAKRPPPPDAPPSVPASCRWSAARVATATAACLAALRPPAATASAAEAAWQPRGEVRTAARGCIGDTGLLDFVLKTLHDARCAGGERVERRVNKATKMLEYRLEPEAGIAAAPAEAPMLMLKPKARPGPAAVAAKPGAGKSHAKGASNSKAARLAAASTPPCREQALCDLTTLHRCILEAYLPAKAAAECGLDDTAVAGASLVEAALIVHDTKLFIKDFCGEAPPPATSALLELAAAGAPLPPLPLARSGEMRVLVSPALDRAGRTPATGGWAAGRPNRRRDPPAELLVLPAAATVGDMKRAAQAALQALYPCLEGYCFESADGLQMNGDRCRVQPRTPGAAVEVWGRGAAALSGPLRFQGGTDAWVVRCGCGVSDDDGERMVACDACAVWKHTRCEGVADDAPAPAAFVCAACAAMPQHKAAAAAAAKKRAQQSKRDA